MRVCPFCNYDEAWVKEVPGNAHLYRVECAVCGAMGPESKTRDGAEMKWDGGLKDFEDSNRFNKALDEDALGGVSSPAATIYNVPAMGTAVPPTQNGIGSGDSWGTPTKKRRKLKRKKAVKEENTNPYDKGAEMIIKSKGGSPASPFKKKLSATNQNSMKQEKFEHQITTLDEFMTQINENRGDIWDEAFANTKTFEIDSKFSNGRSWLQGCRHCNEVVRLVSDFYSPRQYVGNVYQSVYRCSKCDRPVVFDEHKQRLLDGYLEEQKEKEYSIAESLKINEEYTYLNTYNDMGVSFKQDGLTYYLTHKESTNNGTLYKYEAISKKVTKFTENTPIVSVETSGATFTSYGNHTTTVKDLRKGGWNIEDEDMEKLANGELVSLVAYNRVGTARRLNLKRAV